MKELEITDLPTDVATQNLFPKETFFALSIGNAALQLQALTSTLSPIFTVDTENKIQWLDKMVDNPQSPSVMAGVVDIIDGKRSTVVKSLSLAKFLTALVQFYKATESIAQTKSTRLLEKTANGKTNLEILLESRLQVKDLIVGLSNFLSHQIKTESGASLHSIEINQTLVKTTGVLYLQDQVATIEALLDSYEILQTKMYLWSAIDTYFSMNREFWNPNTDFYFGDTNRNNPSFSLRLSTLNALARLKSHLPAASRKQADRILHINTQMFN